MDQTAEPLGTTSPSQTRNRSPEAYRDALAWDRVMLRNDQRDDRCTRLPRAVYGSRVRESSPAGFAPRRYWRPADASGRWLASLSRLAANDKKLRSFRWRGADTWTSATQSFPRWHRSTEQPASRCKYFLRAGLLAAQHLAIVVFAVQPQPSLVLFLRNDDQRGAAP
jgi:hypothetical protein